MTRRPQVLVITPDFPPEEGAIQILSHRIVSSMRTFEPTVVTLGAANAKAFDDQQGFRIVRVPHAPATRALTILALNATATATAIRERPDVVLCMHIVTAPAAALIRLRRHSPYVQYVHAMELGTRPSLARFALTRADRVVAVSRYTRELSLAAGAPPERIVLIAPGVDLPATVRPERQRRDR